MSFYRRYSLFIGIFLLACIIILLLSKPSTMFSGEAYFIDDEPFRASPDGVYVKTKMNLGDSEHMKNFPLVIGEWEGFEYDSSYWEDYLEADAVLLRAYQKGDLYQPVFLQIVQGQSGSSVHQPADCYVAQGYTIEEQGNETLLITDVSWAEDGSPVSIPIKKMVVYKESENQVTERRIVIYWYVEGNRIASNTVTIIEVSAHAPLEGSYERILSETKDFAAKAIPYVFAPSKSETVMAQLIHWGALGYFILISLICIPLVLALFPRFRARQNQNPDQTEPQK
ncbi:MAG: exosortase-associated EpsI family protein [Dehalococcoidia bacterium]|nr:exosortase-associated EpsI family protein [Dehalococcoidia bacterium]